MRTKVLVDAERQWVTGVFELGVTGDCAIDKKSLCSSRAFLYGSLPQRTRLQRGRLSNSPPPPPTVTQTVAQPLSVCMSISDGATRPGPVCLHRAPAPRPVVCAPGARCTRKAVELTWCQGDGDGGGTLHPHCIHLLRGHTASHAHNARLVTLPC